MTIRICFNNRDGAFFLTILVWIITNKLQINGFTTFQHRRHALLSKQYHLQNPPPNFMTPPSSAASADVPSTAINGEPQQQLPPPVPPLEKKPPISVHAQENSAIHQELSTHTPQQLKSRLLELLPRITGKRNELEEISAIVNAMEDKFTPVETLDFMNLAMQGDWQLLFSTNLDSKPNSKLRLRELIQRIEPKGNSGTLTNMALWDLSETPPSFTHTGTFTVQTTYTINNYPRLTVSLSDHVLKPQGDIPNDIEGLVGMLINAMPTELFDPNDLGLDTTYLDGDLRIVRWTGERFEGVRNIFVRRGSWVINPGGMEEEEEE